LTLAGSAGFEIATFEGLVGSIALVARVTKRISGQETSSFLLHDGARIFVQTQVSVE